MKINAAYGQLAPAFFFTEIGERLAGEYAVKHLPSDFKKKNGYLRSIQLSAEYDLYRQNYCGCRFSKKDDLCEIASGK